MTAEPSPQRAAFDWVGLAARLILGGVLLMAGLMKALALGQSVLAVRGFQVLPYELAVAVGYSLPFLEIIVGLLLLTGLLTRPAAVAGGALMIVFTAAIAQAWARGIAIDCGCFSGGGQVAWEEARAHYPWDILRDTGLLLLAVWLAWRPRSRFSLDRALFDQIGRAHV